MGLRLLETLTSALYEDPIVFFREYVQNSVDAFIRSSESEDFQVRISIDKESRTILFHDNGFGIETDAFLEKMTSIGKSDKNGAVDQIGFRGIGRLSAMPFCDCLVFKNKTRGNNVVQEFSWNGKKYNKLLAKSETDDLEKAISEITTNGTEPFDGNTKDHFFEVVIENYSDEIAEMIEKDDFSNRLCCLLPLKYNPAFSAQNEIHKHYLDFMGSDLQKYEFQVFLNGEELFKPYTNDHILESDIVFWELSFNKENNALPQEKMGLLWFTFNRKVTANPVNTPRGLFVRSKNMLMGNENSIADAVTKGVGEYVATYRELTQTINGIYGELLIDTSRLSDNARRDWFRIDDASNQLRCILTDYLKKLKDYRYAASKAFNDTQAKQKREKVTQAYNALTGGFDSKRFESEFYDSIASNPPSTKKSSFIYAEDDIPRHPINTKKIYEEILITLKDYYVSSGEDGIEEFIKVRTHLKQHFNKAD